MVASASIMVFLVVSLVVLAQPPGREGGRVEGGPQAQPGPFGPMRMPVMTALDVNGDGELSAEEIAGATQALSKLDTNKDGKLSREELAPAFPGRGGPAGRGPGGLGGPGGPGPGPGGPGAMSGGAAGMLQAATQPQDDAERAILQTLEDIQQKQGRRMNVPVADARLLRVLAEAIGAKKVVEFGTSNGVSSIWISLALRKTGGQLISHEIDPDTAALARKNFVQAGVAEIVTVVEGDGHEKAAELTGPIDMVFIDADKDGYLDYLQKTLPLLRPGGLILAHNMNPRQASAEFVKAITTNPDLETLFYMDGGGMSVSLKKR
jgi:predicted O-methyltransferase YrrM